MTRPDHRKHERGQGTLEFIIIVPMMLAMISLVLFAGWWSYGKLSTQNAAYSNATWAPRLQADFQVVSEGNWYASDATLREAIGMKPMWSDEVQSVYSSSKYGSSRLGGTGLTVGVSPKGLGWEEFLSVYKALGVGTSDFDLPRGTALFYYSPFMSGKQYR
jgi:hypothetical protein